VNYLIYIYIYFFYKKNKKYCQERNLSEKLLILKKKGKIQKKSNERKNKVQSEV
jgi:hypothetical protein